MKTAEQLLINQLGIALARISMVHSAVVKRAGNQLSGFDVDMLKNMLEVSADAERALQSYIKYQLANNPTHKENDGTRKT